jgi:hypothetical protein
LTLTAATVEGGGAGGITAGVPEESPEPSVAIFEVERAELRQGHQCSIDARKASVGMYSGCDYPHKSCFNTFWPCHPYFILQFYSIVFYTCTSKTTQNEILEIAANQIRDFYRNCLQHCSHFSLIADEVISHGKKYCLSAYAFLKLTIITFMLNLRSMRFYWIFNFLRG